MEENKQEAPIVEIGKGKSAEPTKEMLQKQVGQLAEKCQELYSQLQQANMFNTFKRLDYCFKVVENAAQFDSDFVDYCKKDIVNIMTIVEESPKKEE